MKIRNSLLAYLMFSYFNFTPVFSQTETKPNFIFIVVDDLNDYAEGFNGQPQVKTPNIRNLETQGTTFLNAFTTAPGCAPSRTSFLSGKDCLYTGIYNNEQYTSAFRSYFTAANGNETVFTLPEILKDSGGYYTYAMNKIFHSQTENDYDKTTADNCEKTKSWNRMDNYIQEEWFDSLVATFAYEHFFDWGMIPDSLEPYMEDHLMTDSAMQFIQNYAAGTAATCGKPFFLALGFHRPHSSNYIPESHFLPWYMQDIHEAPFQIIYNDPVGQKPYNGLVMPPQPDPIYSDYYALPEGGVARTRADMGHVYDDIHDLINGYRVLPVIDPEFSDSARLNMLATTTSANYTSAYIAAVQFADQEIGRVLNELNAHPELKNNTYIILVSDHGYSLGEKRHWTKWSLWETDLRIPFIIAAPGDIQGKVCTSTVSLLDLFPTVLEIAGVDEPTFPDGERYPDGHSIMPLLENSSLHIERPVISSVQNSSGNGSCFPHYSVRNERFHNIRYQKNNNGDLPINECDSSSFSYEEELYDIGSSRETDPNEWNNLAADPEYAPIRDYLREYIPGGNMYNRKGIYVSILNNRTACIVNDHATINLIASCSDTNGIVLNTAGLAPYEIKWTNSLTTEVYYGKNYYFNTASIPHDEFIHSDHIIFYATINEIASGREVGCNMKEIFINSATFPAAKFALLTDTTNLSAEVSGYIINGSYTHTGWDFGDGSTNENFLPGIHTYSTPGIYTVKNIIQYGNGCITTVDRTADYMRIDLSTSPLSIFPNPASDQVTVYGFQKKEDVNIEIITPTGQSLRIKKYEGAENYRRIDVGELPEGIYILKITSGEKTRSKTFEVLR